jgi:GNAT superfamily N-acetyltransferase
MEKSKLSFRDATIYDFERIIELYKQLYTIEYLIENKICENITSPEEYFLSKNFKKEVKSRKQKLEDEDIKFIVALYEEQIIGYTMGSVKYHQREKTMILFDDEVIVDDLYRNKGIGDLLIEQMVSWGRVHGAKKMMVFIFKDNKPLINKYTKLRLKDHHACLVREI